MASDMVHFPWEILKKSVPGIFQLAAARYMPALRPGGCRKNPCLEFSARLGILPRVRAPAESAPFWMMMYGDLGDALSAFFKTGL
jgi:hypothetical protein